MNRTVQRPSASGAGVIVFLLSILALVMLLGNSKNSTVRGNLGYVRLSARSIPERCFVYLKSFANRHAELDKLTWQRIRQKDFLNLANRTLEALKAVRVARRHWRKIEHELERRNKALARCPLLLSETKRLLEDRQYWKENDTADLDDAQYKIDTLTSPTRASFEDPNGDYVPGDDIQTRLSEYMEWLEGIAAEYERRSVGIAQVLRKLDAGAGCE